MIKPLLAAKVDKLPIQFPLLASPKLDGVRCLVLNNRPLTRPLKKVPNDFVVDHLSKSRFNWLDGELIVGPPTASNVYRQTTSGVMSKTGEPDFTFYVFDWLKHPQLTYEDRYNRLRMAMDSTSENRVKLLPHKLINNNNELIVYEQDCLAAGFEGVMLRSLEGQYKYGRSTEKEGILLKLKRFDDSEAEILEVEELLHNDNEAITNNVGRLERSSHKENLRGGGVMGSLRVRDVHTRVEFNLGTGFNQDERILFWKHAKSLVGRVVKYKFFASGVKDKPRFPVYLGMRSRDDF